MYKKYPLKIAYWLHILFALQVSAPALSQPIINSVNPLIGQAGTSVIISGSGFNNTPENNIVYFGAARATVSLASSSTLSVRVPLGATYAPVTVTNAATSLTAYSELSFLPAFSSCLPAAMSFDQPKPFSGGNFSGVLATGDLDGDGKPDLIIGSVRDNTIAVFHNSGSVSSIAFDNEVDFPVNNTAEIGEVALGDIDGDGKIDVVVSTSMGNTVAVFRNTSSMGSITSASFAPAVYFDAGQLTYGLAIGDLDGDGKADIVVSNSVSNTISILHNTTAGTISFEPHIDFAAGNRPSKIAVADLDGDNKPEILVINADGVNETSNLLSVFHNQTAKGAISTSSFDPKVNFSTAYSPAGIAVADMDGDGVSDVIISNYETISIFRNTNVGNVSNSMFAPRVDLTLNSMGENILLYNVALADFDGDGKPDLMVSPDGVVSSGNVISIVPNLSSPGSITNSSFGNEIDINLGDNFWSLIGLAIADYDGDGKPDLVCLDQVSSTILALRNSLTCPISFTNEDNPVSTVICQNANLNDLSSLFQVTDENVNAPLTWTIYSNPSHGSVVLPPSSISTGGIVTPLGLKYTPNSGFNGSDAFTIRVSDGTTAIIKTVFITVKPPPTPGTITGSTVVCEGSTGNVYSISNAPSATYVWGYQGSGATINNMGNSAIYNFGTNASNGKITVTETNACGSTTAYKSVILVKFNITPGSTSICEGSSVSLHVGGSTSAHYQWLSGTSPINGATQASYVANTSGQYAVEVTTHVCHGRSSPVQISVLPNPPPVEIISQYIVNSDPQKWKLSADPMGPGDRNSFTYSWLYKSCLASNFIGYPPTTSQIIVSNPGDYKLVISSGNCYSTSVPVHIGTCPPPHRVSVIKRKRITYPMFPGQQLQANWPVVLKAASYQWYKKEGHTFIKTNVRTSNYSDNTLKDGDLIFYTITGYADKYKETISSDTFEISLLPLPELQTVLEYEEEGARKRMFRDKSIPARNYYFTAKLNVKDTTIGKPQIIGYNWYRNNRLIRSKGTNALKAKIDKQEAIQCKIIIRQLNDKVVEVPTPTVMGE